MSPNDLSKAHEAIPELFQVIQRWFFCISSNELDQSPIVLVEDYVDEFPIDDDG